MKLAETGSGELYIGSKDDVLTLIEGKPEIKFDLIWNLAEELDFLQKDEEKYANTVLLAKIKDLGIPNDIEVFHHQVCSVVSLLEKNGKVLIHCLGGCGRTGLVLGVIKKELDGFSGREAADFIKEMCDAPETKEQLKFLLNY